MNIVILVVHILYSRKRKEQEANLATALYYLYYDYLKDDFLKLF